MRVRKLDLAALALDPNLRDQSFELPDGWWKWFVTCYKSGMKRRLTNQVQTRHVIAKHEEDKFSCSRNIAALVYLV